ncbi:hypothetical protein ACFPME_01100 [Rhodanobacter umsongensis]|uniref:Anti sigma-E protein RseA N-terminal domain-containing protein n=1 Tax=Rhodanobacter umsongensis TaxID=633153 RepID=A0ABW0JGZ6_9GAMM
MTTHLPPPDPREPDEKLPGEAELAALYRQLPHSEPGPALDAAVLREAAQALGPGGESPTVLRERRRAARERGDWVHPKPVAPSPVVTPSPDDRRRMPRWPIALSTAASLMLAAGLAWHMRETPPAASTHAAPGSATQTQATAAAPPPAAAAKPAAKPAPPPPVGLPQQPPSKLAVAQRPAPPADTLRMAAADQSAERTSSKAKAIGGMSHDAPAPMSAPAAPPVALQETSGNAVEAASEMPAAMAAAPAPAAPVDATTPGSGDTPAQELDKIRQLFAHGHDREARRRLTAFQHAHPQWDLPPQLRAQLREP